MEKNLFALLLVFICSCNLFESKIDRAINTIDKGIASMNTQSTGWESTINQIATDIPHQAHDIIGNDLKNLSHDVIGATGAETKCDVDFIKKRAIQTLQNLKLKLQGKPYTLPPPEFCTLNIASVDLNSDPISRNTLTLYGYDLNTPDTTHKLLQVALIGDSIKEQIDERYIGRNTNYQLSINLNSLITELVENKFHKIQLYWNGDTTNMPQILIQEWKPKIKPVEFQPQPITFVPPHTGGDADFGTKGGNPTIGKIFVQFNVTKTYIDARVYMDAMEIGGDNTRVGISIDPATNQITDRTAWSPWTRMYSVTDNNFEIQDFTPNTNSEQSLSIDSKGQKLFFMGGGSVASYTVDLDQQGDEAGTYTKVEVAWNKLHAILIEKKPIK